MTETANGTLAALAAFLDAGGPVLKIIAALSVLTLAIVLLKVWQFRAVRLTRMGFVEEALQHWREGRDQAALDTVSNTRNPAGPVLAVAMRGCLDRQVPTELVREEVTRIASASMERLRSMIRGLEVIGALAPMLGLLGTVIGMIQAFQQLEGAGSNVDPALLSGGIWVALLTTAAGLALAIPTIALASLLERYIDQFRNRLEDAVTRVFTQRVWHEQPPEGAMDTAPAAPPARAVAHAT
ncbi:MotA/TolQ/ExbB proton channel family protein [Alkalilimnicola ehrlichii]|uniref:MotA/TolQ/ExbB proton channel family protein n=1 Tax=Alkalilimnicola ehrlichii TaxID=351052 RepID=UPI003BA367BD